MVKGYYPAMTPGEFAVIRQKPDRIAWMSCHFCPEDTGLQDLPEELPVGSILILDDSIIPQQVDTVKIRNQLAICLDRNRCSGLLLDFQRKKNEALSDLASDLCAGLPCPVALTQHYSLPGSPLLLPPIPVDCKPEAYFRPYTGKELWCELSTSSATISVTEKGYEITVAAPGNGGIKDDDLYCHYSAEICHDKAVFRLYRTKEDLRELMEACAEFGVQTWLGLWQELGNLG